MNTNMSFIFKKLFFLITFNITLFLILMIGIQNSYNKKKVNLLLRNSISLPVGFIVGVSFISGSITGGLITNSYNEK
mgnify:FL=1|tara:strand:- start:1218 stop:1448 length:231 start_codon:yes stop_codon:yes gene_type:complete